MKQIQNKLINGVLSANPQFLNCYNLVKKTHIEVTDAPYKLPKI